MLLKKEYFINLVGKDYPQRIRVKMIKTDPQKNKKRDVKSFSVGYEIFYNNKWTIIARHCNYHESNRKEFHTHNKYKLKILGDLKRIIKQNKKKIPASQMRWAIRNLKLNYPRYLKDFLTKIVYNK